MFLLLLLLHYNNENLEGNVLTFLFDCFCHFEKLWPRRVLDGFRDSYSFRADAVIKGSIQNCESTFSTARKAEARFTLLKQEGNDAVKDGRFQAAVDKYSECLAIKPDECAIYTNR